MPGTQLVYMDADAQDREPSTDGIITSSEPSNPEDADIAFPLFGTLVKYPELDPGVRLVLEKAHVVIYQRWWQWEFENLTIIVELLFE